MALAGIFVDWGGWNLAVAGDLYEFFAGADGHDLWAFNFDVIRVGVGHLVAHAFGTAGLLRF